MSSPRFQLQILLVSLDAVLAFAFGIYAVGSGALLALPRPAR